MSASSSAAVVDEEKSNILAAKGVRVTGKFELVAMVTHQGRTADSGHYIGWTRSEKDKSMNLLKKKYF